MGGSRGYIHKIVYVGETQNEKKRMYQYATSGSHLANEIKWHLKEGWAIYYRAYAKSTKDEAIEIQNKMLSKYKYGWNTQRNLD